MAEVSTYRIEEEGKKSLLEAAAPVQGYCILVWTIGPCAVFLYFAHRLFFHILAAHAEFRLQRETSGPYGDPYTRGVSGLVGPVAGD